MWDNEPSKQQHLSHDLPCPYCGHAGHRFLPCDHECGCEIEPLVAQPVRRRNAG